MRVIYFILVATAAIANPVGAKPLATELFKPNTPVNIDPAKAYLLVRSPGDLKLLRVPTATERAVWNEQRVEAFAKANADGRGSNFVYPALESDNFVTFGGLGFDSSTPRTVFLMSVPPGTYRIYGQRIGLPYGIIGYCLCMGTVEFDAVGGTITDMGTIRYPIAEAQNEKVEPNWSGLSPGKGGLTDIRVEPAASSTYMPATLARLPHVAASYRAAGKMDNFFGVLIERLTPLPGILGYRRDQIIDERTGAAVASD